MTRVVGEIFADGNKLRSTHSLQGVPLIESMADPLTSLETTLYSRSIYKKKDGMSEIFFQCLKSDFVDRGKKKKSGKRTEKKGETNERDQMP